MNDTLGTVETADYFDGVAEYPTQIDKRGNLCAARMDARSTVVIEKLEAEAAIRDALETERAVYNDVIEQLRQRIEQLTGRNADLEHTFVSEIRTDGKYAIFVRVRDGHEVIQDVETIKANIKQPLLDLGCNTDSIRVIVVDGFDVTIAEVKGLDE